MNRIGLSTAFVAAALLAGCATGPDSNQQAGTVIGAVVGGIVGNQIGGGDGRVATTIVGALAGGVIGNQIGRSMDAADRRRTAQALEGSRTGERSHWRNPDNGHEYAVTPTRTYAGSQGPCREYTMDTVIGGRTQQVYGTACRQADGSWKTVH